jgi:hypothetical protein
MYDSSLFLNSYVFLEHKRHQARHEQHIDLAMVSVYVIARYLTPYSPLLLSRYRTGLYITVTNILSFLLVLAFFCRVSNRLRAYTLFFLASRTWKGIQI